MAKGEVVVKFDIRGTEQVRYLVTRLYGLGRRMEESGEYFWAEELDEVLEDWVMNCE